MQIRFAKIRTAPTMRKSLIIANWKMNPATARAAVLLAEKIEAGIVKKTRVSVVVAPPFPFISEVRSVIKKARIGAQDTFWEDAGPYTGAVSWRHLKTLGVNHVIVGHSERRIHLGETDEMVQKKVRALLENGMRPILCVGEKERIGNEIPDVVRDQLNIALAGIKKNLVANLVIAYEPVWAISTMPGARSDTPDGAFRAVIFVRKVLAELYGSEYAKSIPVIYGGSVNAANVSSFLQEGKMEGALVGGASLNPKEFVEIVHAAAKIH